MLHTEVSFFYYIPFSIFLSLKLRIIFYICISNCLIFPIAIFQQLSSPLEATSLKMVAAFLQLSFQSTFFIHNCLWRNYLIHLKYLNKVIVEKSLPFNNFSFPSASTLTSFIYKILWVILYLQQHIYVYKAPHLYFSQMLVYYKTFRFFYSLLFLRRHPILIHIYYSFVWWYCVLW